MRLFQIRKCVHLKYENVSLSNTKNASFSNTRMCHFRSVSLLNTKTLQFSDTENVPFSNTKNVPFSHTKNKPISNMRTCRFQLRKMWSVCIFKYECYFFLYQTARHIKLHVGKHYNNNNIFPREFSVMDY